MLVESPGVLFALSAIHNGTEYVVDKKADFLKIIGV